MQGNIDIAHEALGGSVADYLGATGPHLLDRLVPHAQWWDLRHEHGLDPYSKSSDGPILAEGKARDRKGHALQGVNFASQDYLSLSGHPLVKGAACEASETWGVHSAGSPALMGNSAPSLKLEARFAEFVEMTDCTVFPTGWSAGYGLIRALAKGGDHVVLDQLAHASLAEGARAATPNTHFFPHLSITGLERRLKRIRAQTSEAGILVVTESLFSMDSDTPDLEACQEVARTYGATLMVDAAHDLGCMGPTGRGKLEEQGLLGKVDVLMGSFSKTFASNGGFVASNHAALKLALRYGSGPLTFSNAISPIQAQVVLAALAIVESSEGALRREKLAANARALKAALASVGLETLGLPSPIVPAVIGDAALSRIVARGALERGALVNLVEFPAVAKNASRLRLQVMADHDRSHVERLREALRGALLAARRPAASPAEAGVLTGEPMAAA